MEKVYLYVAIVGFAMAAVFMVVSVVLFNRLRIGTVIKDLSGKLAQQQINAIRNENKDSASMRAKVNVFQKMENNSKRLNRNEEKYENAFSQNAMQQSEQHRDDDKVKQQSQKAESGTTVLEQSDLAIKDNFIIEKKLIYTCTSEVL